MRCSLSCYCLLLKHYALLTLMRSVVHECDSATCAQQVNMQKPLHITLQMHDHSLLMSADSKPLTLTCLHQCTQASEHDTSATTAQRALAWLSPPRWCPVQQAQQAQLHLSDCNSDSPSSECDAPLEPIPHSAAKLCESSQQTSRRPRILIVDTNTMCQQLLCRVLRAADCECTTVGAGAAAVELLLAPNQPEYLCDLVFMAVHMPLLNGIAATKALKKVLQVNCPPIVGLTADTSRSTQLQCMRAGMKCVLYKPATQAQILAAVAAHVDLSKHNHYPDSSSGSGNER
jgi:CheY-like chemotaxis protein